MNARVMSVLLLVTLMLVAVTPMPDAMLSPPGRPSEFRSPDELRSYLKALNDYYAIVGRPRYEDPFVFIEYNFICHKFVLTFNSFTSV